MAGLGIIGIVVGVAVLIYGAYKGISTIILAPLCALLIALFNGMNLLTTFTDTMLPSVCNYVTAMLGPVLMGCVIAALYNASGAALSIANALYDLFTIKARKQAAAGQQVVIETDSCYPYDLCNRYCTCLQWNEPGCTDVHFIPDCYGLV